MPGDTNDLPAGRNRLLGYTRSDGLPRNRNAVPSDGNQMPRDSIAMSADADGLSARHQRDAMPRD